MNEITTTNESNFKISDEQWLDFCDIFTTSTKDIPALETFVSAYGKITRCE